VKQNIHLFIEDIAAYFNLTYSDLKLKSREGNLPIARFTVMSIYKKFYKKATWEEVSKILNKDHATAIHAVKVVNNYNFTDRQFAKKYDELMKQIRYKYEG
jgi:chromosomal replication initiator protein